MSVIGFILLALAAITLILAIRVRRSSRVNAAWWSSVHELAPADVAEMPSGAAVAVIGTGLAPQTHSGPVTDPIDGQESVWWRCVTTEHWQERVRAPAADAESVAWERRSRQVSSEHSALPFEVGDGSARIWVNPQEVRLGNVGRSVSRREERAGEEEGRRDAYVDRVCEYVPAGIELLICGRVRSGPTGAAIGPDSHAGLQFWPADAGVLEGHRHQSEVVVERARIAAFVAIGLGLAGAVVFAFA